MSQRTSCQMKIPKLCENSKFLSQKPGKIQTIPIILGLYCCIYPLKVSVQLFLKVECTKCGQDVGNYQHSHSSSTVEMWCFQTRATQKQRRLWLKITIKFRTFPFLCLNLIRLLWCIMGLVIKAWSDWRGVGWPSSCSASQLPPFLVNCVIKLKL